MPIAAVVSGPKATAGLPQDLSALEVARRIILKVKTGTPSASQFGPEKPTPSASQPGFLVSRRGAETGAVFSGFTGFMEASFSV